MARCIAALTVSGESKLTSPWSRRYGSFTVYIMSRMRMMPEKGTLSRKVPISNASFRGRHTQTGAVEYLPQCYGGAGERKIADVEVPDAGICQRPQRSGTDVE